MTCDGIRQSPHLPTVLAPAFKGVMYTDKRSQTLVGFYLVILVTCPPTKDSRNKTDMTFLLPARSTRQRPTVMQYNPPLLLL